MESKSIINMGSISRRLKTQTTALSLFLQSSASIFIGLMMIYDYSIFFTRAKMIFVLYFTFILVANTIQVLIWLSRDTKQTSQSQHKILASLIAIVFLRSNIEGIFTMIPLVMVFWTLILGISSFISFLQYRKEENSYPLLHLLSAILHIGFGIPFMLYVYHHLKTSMNIIGLYLILWGIALFMDALAQGRSESTNKYKTRFRIIPPAFITTFVPWSVLNGMNRFFKENSEGELPLDVTKSEVEANLEIYVHVSKSLNGTAGHVDLYIDGKIICYGAYDKESIKCGGIVGDGVFYEVYDKEEYLKFCQEVKEETVFEYGLALNEEELEKIRWELSTMKARARVWKCKVQRALAENQEIVEPLAPCCKLALATKTVFYKFNSGRYKHYWILGHNCVRFTDDLLKASGMNTFLAGIVTPGTYFTFLNDEFVKGNSIVVRRTVHHAIER